MVTADGAEEVISEQRSEPSGRAQGGTPSLRRPDQRGWQPGRDTAEEREERGQRQQSGRRRGRAGRARAWPERPAVCFGTRVALSAVWRIPCRGEEEKQE